MAMVGAVSMNRIMGAIEADENLGFCIACGADAFDCEPDARKYECEECGLLEVYGAEELLIMGVGE